MFIDICIFRFIFCQSPLHILQKTTQKTNTEKKNTQFINFKHRVWDLRAVNGLKAVWSLCKFRSQLTQTSTRTFWESLSFYLCPWYAFNVQECCSHYHFSVCLFFVLTGLIVTLQVKEKYCQVITRCCLHAHTQTQTLITATICLVLTELCLLVNKYFISTSLPPARPPCYSQTFFFFQVSVCISLWQTCMA